MSKLVKHLRTNVENSKPSKTDLNHGEIAINYNAKSPGLFIKDTDEEIVTFKDEKYYDSVISNLNNDFDVKLNEKADKYQLEEKVDKVDGKGLSSEDFTTILKEKLEGLSNYDDSELINSINNLRDSFEELTSASVSDYIDSVSEILNFLKGVKDTEKFKDIIVSLKQQLAVKVDQVDGKGLSTEDFTTILKEKLEGLSNYDDSELVNNVSTLNNTVESLANSKQDKITDINIIRAGSAKGYTSLQPNSLKTINGESIVGEGNIIVNGTFDESILDEYAKLEQLNNKQDVITDLDSIRDGASKGATATQVSSFKTINGESIIIDGESTNIEINGTINEEDLIDYVKKDELQNSLLTKQDVITDINEIREGAIKGSTSLQSDSLKTINGESIIGSGDITIEGGIDDSILEQYAKIEQLNDKQDVITDLDSIRDGASKGATSLQPNSLKTINGESIVGEGDIIITGDGSVIDLSDYVTNEKHNSDLERKQDNLVSGETIKTINGESILGSGNITIEGGGNVDIDLSKYVTMEYLESALTTKQDTLVSGENIASINGKNLLVGGNIVIEGGGGGTVTTGVVVSASVSKSQIKENDEVILSYSYDHFNSNGNPDGIRGRVVVSVLNDNFEAFNSEYLNVAAGVYRVDITKYLKPGKNEIYVYGYATSQSGIEETNNAYTTVNVVSISLTSDYNIVNSINNGGYSVNSDIKIPYTISGNGNRNIYMYLDGTDTPIQQGVGGAGSVNGEFSINTNGMNSGLHTIQLVAEHIDSRPSPESGLLTGVLSESIYFNILIQGEDKPYIGVMYVDNNGGILFGDDITPKLKAKQYEVLNFDYIVYDKNYLTSDVKEYNNGEYVRTLKVDRTKQTYSNQFTDSGTNNISLVCGETTYIIEVSVEKSDVSITEASQGLSLRLKAAGRSNEEDNKDTWTYGDVTTDFIDVDFKTSGWFDNKLKLINGSKIVINKNIFDVDAAKDGKTIEIEYMVSNVYDKNAEIIHCIDNGKGFSITAEEATMYTGSLKTVTDEDGNEIITKIGVGSKFASDMWLKVAFVIGKRSDNKLMELYINGIRSKADIYADSDSFVHTNPKGITFDSTNADIYIRSVRVYDRALNDDEELGNYIIDRETVNEISDLAVKNDVLDDRGVSVGIKKLREKGKGVMLFVGDSGLDKINATNNKNEDYLFDIYFYSPFGEEYDFELKQCNVRIQGTSSTKYPRKNYRVYLAKSKNKNSITINGKEHKAPILSINGVIQNEDGSKNKYKMREDSIPMNLFCMKCDYSDSSMTHNTGGAKLFNDILKGIDLLTPPQITDSNIRSSVDGLPIDIFAAETIESTPIYYGQYNFNNEKSNSGKLFGMEGVLGTSFDENGDINGTYEFELPIALESLNNTEKFCLFQIDDDLDNQLENEFDDAWEFNYPKDLYWTEANAIKEEGDVCGDEYKQAIKRLFTWIKSCIPSGADTTDYKDIKSFKSDKFKEEANQYFDVNYILTYYLFTDYLMLVDQRAKNMLLRTWDGKKWYITYYDGDTALGCRNDSFLAYDYNITRDTVDVERNKYAFEGHDSWLWCLFLANFEEELRACATKLRSSFKNDVVLNMFNNEQSDNWSERQYNKSGKFKYIDPQINGVMVGNTLTKYPYIYALQGDREAHRTHTINNRFLLLDSKYRCGEYLSDIIQFYLSRNENETPDTFGITSLEDYYFAYGTNNNLFVIDPLYAGENQKINVDINGSYTANDPLRFYGASRIIELDLTKATDNFQGNLELNKCINLRKLDMSTETNGSVSWTLVIDGCKQLREVILNGQKQAVTGGKELNFANQTKLTKMYAKGVEVNSVIFADGCSIEDVILPKYITTLKLTSLPLLKQEGLVIEDNDYSNITKFIFSNCQHLDWKYYLDKCINVKNIRVEGVNIEGDKTFLDKYMAYGGVDKEGSDTSTCNFVGVYQLTKSITEDEMIKYKEHYPELDIRQPEFTTIMFDDSIVDPKNITNLDNETGCQFGNEYKPSGHITKILEQRHRVLGKSIKGETNKMHICQLDDNNSNRYTNGDSAILTGKDGDVYVYEPHYWYKGINDVLNNKKYHLYSSNIEKPSIRQCDIIKENDERLIKHVNKTVNLNTISIGDRLVLNDNIDNTLKYFVYELNVSGNKQIRYPLLSSPVFGAVFVDSNNIVTKTVNMDEYIGVDGMYCINTIDEEYEKIYFTMLSNTPFDYVLLTKSTSIDAMEPEWVEHKECVIGAYRMFVSTGNFPYTRSGENWTNGKKHLDFINAIKNRFSSQNNGTSYSLITWDMKKDITNLFYAAYGNRDSEEVCGRINQSLPYVKKNGSSNSLGMNNGNDNNISCMGYEKLWSYAYEYLHNITYNTISGIYNIVDINKNDITDLSNIIRTIQSTTLKGDDDYITSVYNGKYMDMIPIRLGGSSTSGYCDTKRVDNYTGTLNVMTGGYVSDKSGISYLTQTTDYSYATSRIAFSGEIIKDDVETFLNITEFIK